MWATTAPLQEIHHLIPSYDCQYLVQSLFAITCLAFCVPSDIIVLVRVSAATCTVVIACDVDMCFVLCWLFCWLVLAFCFVCWLVWLFDFLTFLTFFKICLTCVWLRPLLVFWLVFVFYVFDLFIFLKLVWPFDLFSTCFDILVCVFRLIWLVFFDLFRRVLSLI